MASDPDAGLPTLHDLHGILKPTPTTADPTPDTRATVELIAAVERMECSASAEPVRQAVIRDLRRLVEIESSNTNPLPLIQKAIDVVNENTALEADRDAAWTAADALAGALRAVEAKMPNLDWWDTWQTKTMAFREPEAKAISDALAAYTAARAARKGTT